MCVRRVAPGAFVAQVSCKVWNLEMLRSEARDRMESQLAPPHVRRAASRSELREDTFGPARSPVADLGPVSSGGGPRCSCPPNSAKRRRPATCGTTSRCSRRWASRGWRPRKARLGTGSERVGVPELRRIAWNRGRERCSAQRHRRSDPQRMGERSVEHLLRHPWRGESLGKFSANSSRAFWR